MHPLAWDVTRHCVPLSGGYMLVRDRPCELVALLLLTVADHDQIKATDAPEPLHRAYH